MAADWQVGTEVGASAASGTAPLGKPEPATPSRPSGRVSTDAGPTREELNAWLTENCGRGIPYNAATDLAGALHGLSYVLRQIESTSSYKVPIGQCVSATTAIRWALDYFARAAIAKAEGR